MEFWNVIKGLLGTQKSGEEAGPDPASGRYLEKEGEQEADSKLEKIFRDSLKRNDSRLQFDAAQELLTNEEYGPAIDAYRELSKKYLDERYVCEAQIGECYARQRKFQQAVDFYNAARIHGACQEAMDECVWRACISEYRLTRSSAVFCKYITLFPNGKYVESARQYVEAQKARAHKSS